MARRKPKGGFAPVPLPGAKPLAPARAAAPDAAEDAPRPWTYQQLLVGSFVLVAVIPAIVFAIYVYLLASPIYVSEARFALRAAKEDMQTDILSSVAAGNMDSDQAEKASSAVTAGQVRGEMQQNPFVIANFLMSRSYVQELMAQDWLIPRFSRDSIDYFARLAPKATLEAAWRYWTRHAVAAVDRRSNTIFVKVWAYSPQDAQDGAEKMVRRAETLINEMEQRGRGDLVERTRHELQLAQKQYADTLVALGKMRERLATVDPIHAAQSAHQSFIKFEGERIMLARELRALELAESGNSPNVTALRQRAGSIRAEVDRISNRMTGYEADMRAAVNALAVYEELELARRFAQSEVKIAALANEEAELRLRRHSFFVYEFVAPSLPLRPDDSWRWQELLLVTGMLLVGWLILATFATMIRETRY